MLLAKRDGDVPERGQYHDGVAGELNDQPVGDRARTPGRRSAAIDLGAANPDAQRLSRSRLFDTSAP